MSSESSTKKKSTRLVFKGDKPKKKSKKHREDSQGKDDAKDVQDWVLPDNANEILGPTYVFHPSDPPICITYDSTRTKIILHPLPKPEDGPLSHKPADISQVWVTTRVAGSETINLRTPDGKFLSCDQHGLVSANREARGPQEEWTPVILGDAGNMIAFMNIYEKYLGIDEVAGGTLQLRGDSETVGFAERFWVKVQYEYKKRAGEEERKREGTSLGKRKIDEVETNRLYHTWGAGKSVVSGEDMRDLKKARKDGRLSEALLDRRIKLKSDRFC